MLLKRSMTSWTGWCGGSEGVAVTLVAYSLKGLVVHGAMFNQHFPFHLNYGSNTTRELSEGLDKVRKL